MVIKEEYIEKLKNNICEVCFKKKDGTYRVMKCTLMDSFISKTIKEINEDILLKPKRKRNDKIISVFDLEKNGWRSFCIESIITFNII